MTIKAPSTIQMVFTSLLCSAIPPLLLAWMGHNHWLAYVFATVGGYSANAAWRGFQRELLLRTLWIELSDQYIEHIGRLEGFDEDDRQYEHEIWGKFIDRQRRLLRRWGVPRITIEDKQR